MLKSDLKGFLIADHGIGADELTHGINGLRHDTATIIKLIKGHARSAVLQRARVSSPNSRASINPGGGRERNNQGRFIKAQPGAEVAKAVNQMTRQQAEQAAANKRAKAARRNREGGTAADGQARDGRGRFGAGDGDHDKGGKDGLFSRLKSALSGKGDIGDVEKIDPSIEAANELKNLIGGPMKALGSIGESVIGRGFNGDAKGRSIPWYRRMWAELRGLRKQDSEFDKAQIKVLKDIEKKSGHGATGGSGGGLFSGLPGMGGLGGLLGGAGKGLLKMGGGLLKRLPLLGGLLAGGSALASIFGNDDPTKSAEENRKDRFTGAGSGIGALIGGGIGLVGGPVGAMIGGVIGDKVGELVGTWLSTVDWKDVASRITGAWDVVTSYFKEKAAPVINAVKEAAAPVVAAVKAKAAPVLDAVKSGAQAVSDGAGAVVDYGKERVAKMAAPIARLIKSEGTTRIYGMQDGSTEQRDGGSVSWRNNNPGNLKFEYAGSADKTVTSKRSKEDALAAAQKRYGAGVIDLDQWGNAIFNSEDSGRAAKAQLLKTSHGNKTIGEMLPKYAVADYSGKADTKAYANSIYKLGDAKGLDLRGKKIGDLSDAEFNTLLDGMKKVEGFKVGATRFDGGLATNSPLPSIASTMPALGLSAPMKMPSISVSAPSLPTQAPRADIPVPLNSRGPLEVIVRNDQLASRDLPDRRLASIATGGLSN